MEVVEVFSSNGSFQLPRVPENGNFHGHFHGSFLYAVLTSAGFHQVPSTPNYIYLLCFQ